jgi:hypothetical protein
MSNPPRAQYRRPQTTMLTASKGLREHLLAAQAGQPVPPSASPSSSHDMHIAHSPNQHIDPAIGGGGGPGYPMPLDDSMEEMNDMRKGRRELSTSKRAAQNRAAQRAFRQRKEQYIQSLKDQVKEHQNLAANYETIQKENFSLRQYIITLQARLLESHTELPPPPESIDLSRPPPTIETSAPQAPMGTGSIGDQLQAAAAAAAAEANEGRQSYSQHHQGGRMPEGAMNFTVSYNSASTISSDTEPYFPSLPPSPPS